MRTYQLLLLVFVPAIALASRLMPRFEFTQPNKIMLYLEDTWEAGSSDMLALLSDTMEMYILVNVTGDTGGGLKRTLFYKCPRNATEDSIDISSLASSLTLHGRRCTDTISFRLSADAYRDRIILFMESSKLSYSEVFRERIELRVKVEYSSGVLQSNRLFLRNLQPLISYDSISARFLTDEAVSFMKQMPPSTNHFKSIQFLDPEIIAVLRDAPEFFKTKVELGAALFFDNKFCVTRFEIKNLIVFINHLLTLETARLELLKLTNLNIDDGKLWYSTCGLRNEAKRFSDQENTRHIQICPIFYFSSKRQRIIELLNYRSGRFPFKDTSYSSCNASIKTCEVISGTNSRLTIFAGMNSVAIVCPIICDDIREGFRFYKDDRELVIESTQEWTSVDGVEISSVGNILRLPPTLSTSHQGVYRCEAGSKSFSYTVSVISLPNFESELFLGGSNESFLGALPPKVFAMEGEYLSYNCEVRFAGLQTVRMDPVFHFATSVGGSPSWKRLTLDQFRSRVNMDDKNFILNVTSIGNDGKRLTVTVLQVPPVYAPYGTNFTHRFVCNVSVDKSESSKFGMPAYAIQSGSDVVFIPRLTRRDFVLSPNNGCSGQNCEFEKGVLFEFGLTDDLSKFLADIGVEVVSFFRLDTDLLDNVKILDNKTSEIIANKAAPQRLAYRIFPLRSSHQKTLTPVFNFRYKTSVGLRNLKLDKERHGPPIAALDNMDCRQDPLCFYSTDFDLESSLSFLQINLTFTMLPTNLFKFDSAQKSDSKSESTEKSDSKTESIEKNYFKSKSTQKNDFKSESTQKNDSKSESTQNNNVKSESVKINAGINLICGCAIIGYALWKGL